MATSNTSQIALLSAVATNTTGTYYSTTFRAGRAQLVVGGTFDGANVTFNFKDPAGNVIPVTDLTGTTITITSAKGYIIEIPYGEQINAVLAGAGAGTSLSAYLQELKEMR